MYNEFVFNERLWNGPQFGGDTASSDMLVFDGFPLADNVSAILLDVKDSAAKRELLTSKIPRGNGISINGLNEREKLIPARVLLKKSTGPLLEAYLDTIRQRLAAQDVFLDITRHGIERRYVATVVNMEELFEERSPRDVTKCLLNVTFLCKEGFATDRNYTSRSEEVTTSPQNHSFENTGSAPAPIIGILNFSAANSITAVVLKNETTGVEIEAVLNISPGDVVRFDSENFTVTKNGVEVDYSGAFPELDPGMNVISWTVTGTSFSAYSTLKSKMAYR
jgi:phage-related protein